MRSFRTQHSTSTSGSNRRVPPRRGSSSPAHLGPPLLPPLVVWVSLVRGVSSHRGAPPADPRFLWIRSPFFWSYVFFPELVYAREVPPRGRSDVFSRPRLPTFSQNRIVYFIALARLFCGAFFYRGGRTRFPRSRLCTTSSSLLHSTILLISTRSSCASVAWGEHSFRGGSIGHSFRSSKVGQWVLAHWFVLSCIRPLEPRRLAKPPRVSPLHV